MKLVRLTPETVLDGFDCGDEDLNNFLVEDAKGFLDKRIATSYILEDCVCTLLGMAQCFLKQ